MARTEIIERQLFTFDELDDSAKEKARDWYRSSIEADELANYDDWKAIADILGVQFAMRDIRLMGGGARQEPKISWSGFWSQGDGAKFHGSYSYAKGATKRIREYAPQDRELHRIADELQTIQKRHFYKLCADMGDGHLSNHYSHSGTMSVDCYHSDDQYRDIGEAESALADAMRSFADWIYDQLEKQWNYLNSNEAIDESIFANGYEFTDQGAIA